LPPEVDRALSAREPTGIIAQSRNQLAWIDQALHAQFEGAAALTDCRAVLGKPWRRQ